ncbi:Chagasin family peptidase inhibitor I42 [Citrobacter koseri]|uniref:Chagasin family peptidase inhibitor I42 n=1 Tax=Citrobacter koseri TaxID=545 RepID=A0A078LMP0_CITKO|nr:Chagasin family peptidase inhibitor I42 [Citrobacter koseri]
MEYLLNVVFYIIGRQTPTTVFIIPAMSFATEQVQAMPKDNAGYYNLNVGYYDKPQLSGYLPKKGEATIETNQSAVFSITLPASPSTGYSWGLRTLPSQLMFLDASYRQSDDCKGLGCGGETTYTFKAMKQ